MKIQHRRQRREQEAYVDSLANEPEADAWQQIAPFLDDAIGCLGEKDHDAIVLRFFEGKDFKQVGMALGISEDTARMRTNRAVDKLRVFFTKRGVTVSAAVIAGAVSANSVQAAPIGMAASVTVAAVKGTTVTASTWALVKAALKGGITAKTVSVIATKLLSLMGLGGPILGIVGGFGGAVLGSKVAMEGASSPRVRAVMAKNFKGTWIMLTVYFSSLIGVGVLAAFPFGKAHVVPLCASAIVLQYACIIVNYILSRDNYRAIACMSAEDAATGGAQGRQAGAPYEYKSRWTFLGLPLVHIRSNCQENGKTLPAKGWIAGGNVAYGVVFACGKFAVGAISVGVATMGLLSLGGVAVGGVTFGALGLGYCAFGFAPVGWIAAGLSSMGWRISLGVVGVAHDYAQGEAVSAAHANDAAAYAFCEHNFFLRYFWVLAVVIGVFGMCVNVLNVFKLRRLKRQKLQKAL